MEKMKITLSLLALSSVMFASSINGQQYEDMMTAAHELKTFEKVYYSEKKTEPKVEVPVPMTVEAPIAAPVASIPEVVEGSGVPDDECAADKKPEDSASK
jgi:hypothetical protein